MRDTVRSAQRETEANFAHNVLLHIHMYGCTCTVRVVLLEGTSYSVLHYRAPRAFNVDRTLALYMWLIFWVGRETTACFRRTTAIYWFARFQRVCARLGGAYDDGCPLEQQANGAGMGTGQLGCRIYSMVLGRPVVGMLG